MRNVAFKRAKHSPKVAESLHSDYITEHAYTDLFEEGFHKAEDGYEILPEDQFIKELSKNDNLHREFLAKKEQLEKALQASLAAEAQVQAQQEKLASKEYEQFLKWKKSQGKR